MSTVAGLDSNGFSMPNAAVCNTLPLRITATPAETSPRPTVSAEITASKASPSNGRSTGGSVVDVVVDVVVDGGGLVVVVDGVVEVGGGSVVVDAAVVVDVVMMGGMVVDVVDDGLAAVSFDELVTEASATTAMPAAPTFHARFAMTPFSLAGTPVRRHP